MAVPADLALEPVDPIVAPTADEAAFPAVEVRKALLASAVVAMIDARLDAVFIADVCTVAARDREAFGILRAWLDAPEAERAAQSFESKMSEVLFDHLWEEYERRDAGAFELTPSPSAQKKWLRDLIERNGGVCEVARRAKIPQPSLSRMVSSASVLRPATRVKLAAALGVSPESLATPKVMKRDGT